MTAERRTRPPVRNSEQRDAWARFLEDAGLPEEAIAPPPREDRFQVAVHLGTESSARKALVLWSAHLGTAGFGDLARVFVLKGLRELGRPPGWVGKWDPDDLF